MPSRFAYDVPSFERLPHGALSATSAPQTGANTPRCYQALNAVPGNCSDFQLLNLQIEKHQLEIHLLEHEVQEKVPSLMPTSSPKPSTISSLDTVRDGINTSKSQCQLNHNTHKNGPIYTFHSPFPGRNLKIHCDVLFMHDFTVTHHQKNPTKELIITWIAGALSEISEEMIESSFFKVYPTHDFLNASFV